MIFVFFVQCHWCDGDLLQRNLMFSLHIYTSDSHLDRVTWINSSKNVHVHLQECHSYINQAKITDSLKQISFIWSSISNLRHCLKIINYLIILEVHTFGIFSQWVYLPCHYSHLIWWISLITWLLFVYTADCCSLCNVTYSLYEF